MNRLGLGVLHSQLAYESREFKSGPIARRGVKWRPALGSTAQNVFAAPAPLVLAIAARLSARHGGTRRSNIGMEGYRFLVQTDDRFSGNVGALMDFQNIFHLVDVFIVQFGDTPHFFPPRLKVVVQQQDPDRFPPNTGDQLPLDRLLGCQSHRATRLALWRFGAYHGDDALLLTGIKNFCRAGAPFPYRTASTVGRPAW